MGTLRRGCHGAKADGMCTFPFLIVPAKNNTQGQNMKRCTMSGPPYYLFIHGRATMTTELCVPDVV